jgi:hypothetical protein
MVITSPGIEPVGFYFICKWIEISKKGVLYFNSPQALRYFIPVGNYFGSLDFNMFSLCCLVCNA